MSGTVLPSPSRVARRGRAAVAPAALVSGAMLAVNALAYGFTVLATRALSPHAFGELAALMGLLVIGGVPGTALQTAAALHLAGRPGDARARARLHGTALGVTLAVGVLGLVAVVPLQRLLHLDGPSSALWLVALLLPQTLVGGYQGLLQGGGAYGRLGVVLAGFGLAKVAGGIAGVLVAGTPAAALAGMAAGSAAGTLLGWALCDRPGVSRDVAAPARAAARASGALLGLVVLVNLDVLLARHFLTATEAGEYAVAGIFTKVAFWLPAGVAVVLLPRLGDAAARRRALPVAVGLVAASGLLLTAATAVLGGSALPLVGGPGYGHVLGGAAWLFTALGALFAVAQLLLYSGIAAADRTAAAAVWAAVVAEAGTVQAVAASGRATPLGVVGTVLAVAVLLVGVGALRAARGSGGR